MPPSVATVIIADKFPEATPKTPFKSLYERVLLKHNADRVGNPEEMPKASRRNNLNVSIKVWVRKQGYLAD